jgi:AP-3 complex subunit mu
VVTGGVSETNPRAPSGTLPNIPWRRAGVRHNPNEIYLDIIEEVDAVLDSVGNVISFDVAGCIQIQSKLSGIPDLLLTFKDPTIIDDCSFHPCVRYARYETDRLISFVPPDGNFTLMRYRVRPSVLKMGFTPPIICMPSFRYEVGTATGSPMNGLIDIKLSARSISTLFNMESRKSGVTIEEVSVTIPFPKIVKTANLKVNFGQVLYDEASKIAKWTVGNLDDKMKLQLTGEMKLESTRRPDENPPLGITWKIPSTSLSGLSVGGLSVTGEYYKPYKGVRNIAKSGRFQIRCS